MLFGVGLAGGPGVPGGFAVGHGDLEAVEAGEVVDGALDDASGEVAGAVVVGGPVLAGAVGAVVLGDVVVAGEDAAGAQQGVPGVEVLQHALVVVARVDVDVVELLAGVARRAAGGVVLAHLDGRAPAERRHAPQRLRLELAVLAGAVVGRVAVVPLVRPQVHQHVAPAPRPFAQRRLREQPTLHAQLYPRRERQLVQNPPQLRARLERGDCGRQLSPLARASRLRLCLRRRLRQRGLRWDDVAGGCECDEQHHTRHHTHQRQHCVSSSCRILPDESVHDPVHGRGMRAYQGGQFEMPRTICFRHIDGVCTVQGGLGLSMPRIKHSLKFCTVLDVDITSFNAFWVRRIMP